MKPDNQTPKYIFIFLEIIYANYEHIEKLVRELPAGANDEQASIVAQKQAEQLFSTKCEKTNGGYFFNFFENEKIFVEVGYWKYIEKSDYDVLRKYL